MKCKANSSSASSFLISSSAPSISASSLIRWFSIVFGTCRGEQRCPERSCSSLRAIRLSFFSWEHLCRCILCISERTDLFFTARNSAPDASEFTLFRSLLPEASGEISVNEPPFWVLSLSCIAIFLARRRYRNCGWGQSWVRFTKNNQHEMMGRAERLPGREWFSSSKSKFTPASDR